MPKCFVGHEQLFTGRESLAHWHRENFVRTKSATSFGLGQDSRGGTKTYHRLGTIMVVLGDFVRTKNSTWF